MEKMNMTKVNKIVVGALIAVVSLIGVGTCVADNMGYQKSAFIAKKLELNEVQKANFENLKKVISEQRQASETNKMPEEVKALLSAPVLDQYQALTLFEQKAAKMKESAPIIIAAIANFTDSLSTEQKVKAQEMMEMMEKFGRHRGGEFRNFPFK
jgi:hypothetical protein